MFSVRQLARRATGVAAWAALCLGMPLAWAQAPVAADAGAIAGTVLDMWEGRPLPAVVVLVRGTTLAATTDAAGRFTLKDVPPGEHIVVFSRSGFARATVTEVRVAAGQETRVDINLRPEFYEMEEYQITVEELERQNIAILETRHKTAAFTDALGSEFLSRVGAGDAAEAVAKVTGATIVDGKYAVIRGLADRYTATTLNGGEVPTADPYRKAAQLDLVPSSMIDQIVVSKTFTPDQPGGFTGGAVNIVTKSFPEKFLLSFSLGVSYNTQASLNDSFLTYQGGDTDWLGLDDGTRELPDLVRNTSIPVLAQGTPLNADQAALRQAINQSFGSSQLVPEQTTAPLNHSFSFSIGDTVPLGERRFGYFVGVSYDRDLDFYDNGVNARYEVGRDFSTGVFPPPKALLPTLTLADTRAVDKVAWGAIVSLALEPAEGHEVGFNFLFNQVAEDEARVQSGVYDPLNDNRQLETSTLHWTERQLLAYQLRGQHELPALLDMRIDWLASLANTSQDEPDLRFFSYFRGFAFGQPIFVLGDPLLEPVQRPSRYFRELDEDNHNFKLDDTIPFSQWSGLDSAFKLGGYYSDSKRTYDERTLSYFSDNNFQTFTTDGNAAGFLTESNILAQPAGNGLFAFDRYIRDIQGSFNYDGRSTISATYAMVDLPLLDSLRIIGGARLEKTKLRVESFNASNGQTTTSTIEQTDVLPGVGLVYTIITNMNLRLAYGQTVARPTFREFSDTASFEYAGGEILQGNPNLKVSSIRNYDLRWEWFRRPGEVLAASVFYKDIEDPIEVAQIASSPTRLQYVNSASATLWGFELEGRSSLDFIDPLLKDFNLGANFTFIESEVPRSPVEQFNRRFFGVDGADDRPLYDQSPYIVNVDLTYDNPRSGTTVSVVFNLSGRRLFFAGYTAPDVYEDPAPQLDFFIAQRLGKRWKAKFYAKNLLNPEFRRVYDSALPPVGASEPVYSSYTKGLDFGLSFSFDY